MTQKKTSGTGYSKSTRYRCLTAAALLALSSAPVFAETIELVTYYPSSATTGQVDTRRLHADRATIGNPPYSITVPADADLPPGTLLVADRVGIGTAAPAGPLHVVGVDGGPSSVLFMPGVGGTLRVGIGTETPEFAALEVKGPKNPVTEGGNVVLAVSQAENNPGTGPLLALRRFRGTDAVPAIVADGDLLGGLQFEGFDGAVRRVGAAIRAEADGDTDADEMPGRLVFATTRDGTSNPVERMRITNNGNVGIGTTAPATELEVVSTRVAQPRGILSSQYNTGGNSALFIGRKARGTLAAPIAVANGDFLTGLVPEAYDGANYQQTGWAGFRVNGAVAGGSVPSDFIVSTGAANQGTEKFRVTSAGRVGIGTTAPEQTLHVRGAVMLDRHSVYIRNPSSPAGARTWGIVINTLDGQFNLGQAIDSPGFGGGSTTTSPFVIRPGAPSSSLVIQGSGNVGIGVGSSVYKLDVAGSAHATSFPTSSDARLKTHVAPLTDVLKKLDQVRAVQFDWNETYKQMGRASGHREIGVIAQDLEKVFPELVSKWGDESYRAVDYGRFTAVLLQAIEELKAQNEAQQKEINELKEHLSR